MSIQRVLKINDPKIDDNKRVYERTKKRIQKKGYEFDFSSNNIKKFEAAKEAYINAFIPTTRLFLEEEDEKAEDIVMDNWNTQIKAMKRFIEDKRKFYLHAVKKRGRIAAFALFYVSTDRKNILVTLLAVHTDHQRQGLGSILIESIFYEKGHEKIDSIELGTNRLKNRKAIRFYLKNGFKIVWETSQVLILNKKRPIM